MLYLHIGLHKTGTTFLQQAVFPKWKGLNYIPEDKLEFLLRMDDSLDYLLSREGLSGKNWAHSDEREGNIRMLARLFPKAKVLLSFRKHSSFITSSYKQYLQQGGYLCFEDYFDIQEDKGFMKKDDFLFRSKVELVNECFEHKPFIMLYDEITKNLESFLKGLQTYIGGEAPNASDVKMVRHNKSVSYIPAKLLRYMNKNAKSEFNRNGKYDLYHWRLKKLGLDPRSICQYKLRFFSDRPLLSTLESKYIDDFYALDWGFIKESALNCKEKNI